MDTIDVAFQNSLGTDYGYTNKSVGNYNYRCQIFPKSNPTNIIVDVTVRLKTAAFAAAIGKLLQAGANALAAPKQAKEFSSEFNQTEFS